MTTYVRNGGAWTQAQPRVRCDGEWKAGDLYVRCNGEWKKVYDASAGALLAPENLAVDSSDHNSATISWTNPAQSPSDPTQVQVRIAQLGAVWTELDYPITTFQWNALDPGTEYLAQVRYIIRTDGVITDTSPIADVTITTDAAPVGAPAPDPGGTGGDTVVPITGIGGGSPPGTAFGTWAEWRIQLLDQDVLSWSSPNPPNINTSDDGSTAIVAEIAGTSTEVSWSDGDLTAGETYRVCKREVTDSTGDGTGDTFGAWECGDAFAAPSDWTTTCGGFPDSTNVTGVPAVGDAALEWRFPKFCLNEDDDEMVLLEAVTNVQVLKGPGFFAHFTDSLGEQGASPLTTLTSAPFYPTMSVALPTTITKGSDWSMVHRFKALAAFSGSSRSYALFSGGGGAYAINVTESATGWTFEAKVLADGGGFVTLTSSELAYDNATHTIAVTWDADGTKTLYVDGVSEDTDTGTDVYESVSGFSGVTSTPAYMIPLQQMGWSKALSESEVTPFTGLSTLFSDDFTGTNGDYLENRTGWVAGPNTDLASTTIQGNMLDNQAGSLGDQYWRVETPMTGQEWEIEFEIHSTYPNFSQITVGSSAHYNEGGSGGNGYQYRWDINGNTNQIVRNGSVVASTTFDILDTAGDVVRVTWDGVDTMTMYHNDVEKLSYTDPSPLAVEQRYLWFSMSYSKIDNLVFKCSTDGYDSALGGDIISHTDGRNYHFFSEDGTFDPNGTTRTCELTAVGGGGYSGSEAGYYASGGAGGVVRTASGQSISASTAVTIGAGGVSGGSAPSVGGSGGDTTIGALLTATGGEGGRADGSGEGGDNADYNGQSASGSSGGGGAGSAGNGGAAGDNSGGDGTAMTHGPESWNAAAGGRSRGFGGTTGASGANASGAYGSGKGYIDVFTQMAGRAVIDYAR